MKQVWVEKRKRGRTVWIYYMYLNLLRTLCSHPIAPKVGRAPDAWSSRIHVTLITALVDPASSQVNVYQQRLLHAVII